MDREIRILRLAGLAAAILMPVVAAAQAPPNVTPPVAPKAEQLDPQACAQNGGDAHATVGQGGGLDMQNSGGRSLSERLAQSGGVICPPAHVDPEIKVPTPPGGSMPVIPPPGSPGGDPNVRPK